MKAIVCTRYGPPEVLQLREMEKPAPKDNEIRIRIDATAVTASDCIVRSGKVALKFWLLMRLVLGFRGPRKSILGMVFAGEVDSVGKAAKSFKPGDRVFGFDRFAFSTYAEYKCVSESGVIALSPSNATYEEAAAIPYGGLLALHFLGRGPIQSGQKVLIYGASGAIGTLAVQLANHFGAEVTGVCSTTNLELGRSLGAEAVIDYTQGDFTKRGALYDVILDAVGKRKSSTVPFNNALAPNGKFISVDDGSPKLRAEDLILLKELVEAGKLKPVIDRRYPLEQMAEAHRYVDTGHKKGNVVITVGHSDKT